MGAGSKRAAASSDHLAGRMDEPASSSAAIKSRLAEAIMAIIMIDN
jgi:hypothetical protein